MKIKNIYSIVLLVLVLSLFYSSMYLVNEKPSDVTSSIESRGFLDLTNDIHDRNNIAFYLVNRNLDSNTSIRVVTDDTWKEMNIVVTLGSIQNYYDIPSLRNQRTVIGNVRYFEATIMYNSTCITQVSGWIDQLRNIYELGYSEIQ